MASIMFVIIALFATAGVGWLIRRALVIAQPDEWLLSIRNGTLVKAGIGIRLWRRPGDVVARFTSTLQRVGFRVDALSSERLRLSIEGFILWSVSADGDAPFRAFQKLGLVNLDAPSHELLKSPKHLLSTPQHHAFQRLLEAAMQRLSATRSLEQLLLRQDALVVDLRAELATLERQMGIRIDLIEILEVRPLEERLLTEMSTEVEQRLKEHARGIELETTERMKRRSIEAEQRIAQREAEARKQELERQKAIRLAELAQQHELNAREQELQREHALFAEKVALEVAKAVGQREALELDFRLARIRHEAEANRDAMSLITVAEEKKSQAVRDHELSRLVAEKVGDALSQLPIRDARWITVGPDSPAGSIATLITAARETFGPRRAAG